MLHCFWGGFLEFLKIFVQKPCFRIRQLSGPNCCAVLSTGEIYNESPVHRTAISVYLRVTNTGNVSSSIDNVEAAFHWHLKPFSLLWLRYRFFWCWIRQPAVSLDPFMVSLGEQQKIYPFLLQCSHITGFPAETYLRVGQSVNGVIYFEGEDSWGGCFPALLKDGTTKIKISVVDSFNKRHFAVVKVPVVRLSEARKINSSFGGSFSSLKTDEQLEDFLNSLDKKLN